MAKIRYLDYQIFLTDRDEVAALNVTYPNGIQIAPTVAAVTYSAPIREFNAIWTAPATSSPWFWSVVGDNYPRNEATFTRKSGGWFGISWLFGSTVTFVWVGKFIYGPGQSQGPEIDDTPVEVVAMARRRFITGFEIPQDGEGAQGNGTRTYCREASRHPDGMGWAFRGDTGIISSYPDGFGSPGGSAHWDRFYVRIRKAPTSAARFWLGSGTANGIELKLNPNLTFLLSNMASGTMTPITTSSRALELDVWKKVDIVVSYATAGAGVGAYVEVYIGGLPAINHRLFPATGLGVIGGFGAGAPVSLGSPTTVDYWADFDDWVGAETPTKESVAPFRYVGKDWLNGSKVQRVMATEFGAGDERANWTNDSYSNLNQYPDNAQSPMVSIVPAAKIVVNTDAARCIDAQQGALGIAALTVGVCHTGVTAGVSMLAFQIAGGTVDWLALPSSSGFINQFYMHRLAGLIEPITPIAPLSLHYLKDNDATSDTVHHLGCVAELIGVFGPEDVFPRTSGATPPATPAARVRGTHNNPYPESPWARDLKVPGPYIIHSGTYAGNDIGHDLIFRLPVHWFYVRKVGTVTNAPGFWFSSMIGSHQGINQFLNPTCPVQAFIDPTFVGAGAEDDQEQRTILRITGAMSVINATGSTYQWVAVSDPAARFLQTGALAIGGVDATDVHALPNPDFAPESAFVQYEASPGGGAAGGGYFKGLGHAADGISSLPGAAETLNFLSWAAGALTTLPAATVSAALTVAYALWRRDDGSGDAGTSKTVQMGTYVGDGTASRTIAFGPIGLRPLWVSVTPHGAQASIVRDPSNTGTTSVIWTGANQATTGITAGGIDTFTVGILLNATGVTYSWFLLPGGTVACENGFSCNGEFLPVEPEIPEGVCLDPEATNFGEFGVCVFDPDPGESTTCDDPAANNYGALLPCTYDTTQPPGGECLPGELTTCVTETTSLVNLALFEIGVSRLLTDYCTQMTREAVVARTVFNNTVRTVLHAYPWPFATRYRALTLAPNQPNNADWTYAYLLPSDCVFARRLVVSRGTGVDPEPPAFMMSSDDAGGLLFTNEAGAVLEYTCRPGCVAVLGDALFIETLKWKLGAVLAPPLTRMDEPAARCQKEYEKCLELANAIRKPGVPGRRPAADPASPDLAAVCVTANIQVVNRGLLRIGAQTIINLATDQSRGAVAATLILEDEIRASLRDYPWKFAKRYDDALVLVAGTTTVAANPDWQYSYRLPTDYVMARRLVAAGTGRKFEDSPPPWEVGTDATGDLLFTDVVDPALEYTARIACAVQKGDELFRDALAWRLAAALAPSLAQVDPAHPEQVGRGPDAPPDPKQRISHKPNQAAMRAQAVRYAQTMYRQVLERARIQDANEAEPEDPVDAEWIRGR